MPRSRCTTTGDPHAALQCSCCPEDHHHGKATETTGVPCRPVTHIYIGEVTAPGTGGLTTVANMTDQNRVNWILQAFFTASATTTFTPGTGGGSAMTVTPPFKLRLMSATGSNVANGTELTTTGGYTAGGASLGTTFCAAPSGGTQSNSNLVSWTATGTWATVNGIEIWDTAGLRWLQGAHHRHHRGGKRGYGPVRGRFRDHKCRQW